MGEEEGRAHRRLDLVDDEDDADDAMNVDTSLESEELQGLLQDAAEIENAEVKSAEAVLERQLWARSNLGKRKRDAEDEADS